MVRQLLLRILALLWSLFSHCVCMLGGLHPPTVRPRSHFSFSLSPLLALCYPILGLYNYVRDAHAAPLFVLIACVPLWLTLVHPRLDSQTLCLLFGWLSFARVSVKFSRSLQLCQFLFLLSIRPLNAAPLVAGGSWSFAPPSPFPIFIYLNRLKCGFPRCLRPCGCRSRVHRNRHIHKRVAPPRSSFSHNQVILPANSEFGHHSSCERLLVFIVGCLLVNASRQSRFRRGLFENALRCVDSSGPPPPAVSLVLGSWHPGPFDI